MNKLTTKDKALHRIRIIKGHVSAVEKMLESGAYCVDVVHQSLAIQKALKQFDKAVMEDHIKNCVVHQAKSGHENKIVEELLSIYNYK